MTKKNPGVPEIKPHKHVEFEFKQSKYGEHVPKLPMRAIAYGPSGSGKTVLLQNLILDVYRDCFARIYLWSPSIHVDHTWKPVFKYIEEHMGIDPDKEPYAFESYDPEELGKQIDLQFRIAELAKKQSKKVPNVLILVDDFADVPEFTRQSKLLHQLYIRGRHAGISVITSVQKCVTLHPLIRTQATHTFTFRLRSFQCLEVWLNENSAIYDKKTLLSLYRTATEPRFGFLYMNLMEHDPTKMFYYKFEARLVPRVGLGSMAAHDPTLLGSHAGMQTHDGNLHNATQHAGASAYPSQTPMMDQAPRRVVRR